MTPNANLLVVGENLAAFSVAKVLVGKGFQVRGLRSEKASCTPFALAETFGREGGGKFERRKGEWVSLTGEVVDSWSRALCVRAPAGKSVDRAAFGSILESVGPRFDLVGRVESLDLDKHQVSLSDGSLVEFMALVWCRPLSELRKALKGQVKVRGGRSAGKTLFALGLELKLTRPLLNPSDTYLYPFRFKDKKITAIGVSGDGADWVFSLDDEIAVDAEETAKVMRTFKRELWKEFPELAESFVGERIVQFSPLFVEEPWGVDSLEVAPGVFFLGTEVRAGDGDARGFALLNEQIEWIDQTLSSRGPAGQTEPLSC